jgi:RecA-family ATPase
MRMPPGTDMHAPENEFLQAALGYAERGWHIFPCDPMTKRPVVARGLHDATNDSTIIRQLWATWPCAMVAVRTGPESGIWAIDLDIDAEKDVDGVAAFAKVAEGREAIPETITTKTPRGGIHKFFAWTDGIKNTAGQIAVGVDTRGEGGYCILPPSMRSDRKHYECLQDVYPAPPAAPQWLIDLVVNKPKPVEPSTELALLAQAAKDLRRNGNGIGYGKAALDAEIAKVANARPGSRNHTLNAAAFSLGQLVAGGVLSESEVVSALLDAANACGLMHEDGREAVLATSRSGLSAGMKQPRTPPGRPCLVSPASASPASSPASLPAPSPSQPPAHREPLPFIDMSNWDNEPVPQQDWSVLNRIPLRQCVLFTGEGAAGKSSVQLHLSAAHVLGRDWLGTMPEPGPAIFFDAEDDEKVIHRRLAAIAGHYGVKFADLIGGLHIVSLVGKDAVLATIARTGKVEPTPLYMQLLETAGDIKPKMIGIASSANIFAGDEVNRSQVQQLVGLLTRMAIIAEGSVVLIAHPSLTGINTDTGLSGSTQWHNAVRARFYMKGVEPESGEQPDDDLREIVFKKNQYGPKAETIVLRYTDGLFLPVPGMTSLDRAAQEAKAKDVFLNLLGKLDKQGRTVSDRPNANNYAPTVFAAETEAKAAGIRKTMLEDAMRSLFEADKMHLEPYGPPSKGTKKLALGSVKGTQ